MDNALVLDSSEETADHHQSDSIDPSHSTPILTSSPQLDVHIVAFSSAAVNEDSHSSSQSTTDQTHIDTPHKVSSNSFTAVERIESTIDHAMNEIETPTLSSQSVAERIEEKPCMTNAVESLSDAELSSHSERSSREVPRLSEANEEFLNAYSNRNSVDSSKDGNNVMMSHQLSPSDFAKELDSAVEVGMVSESSLEVETKETNQEMQTQDKSSISVDIQETPSNEQPSGLYDAKTEGKIDNTDGGVDLSDCAATEIVEQSEVTEVMNDSATQEILLPQEKDDQRGVDSQEETQPSTEHCDPQQTPSLSQAQAFMENQPCDDIRTISVVELAHQVALSPEQIIHEQENPIASVPQTEPQNHKETNPGPREQDSITKDPSVVENIISSRDIQEVANSLNPSLENQYNSDKGIESAPIFEAKNIPPQPSPVHEAIAGTAVAEEIQSRETTQEDKQSKPAADRLLTPRDLRDSFEKAIAQKKLSSTAKVPADKTPARKFPAVQVTTLFTSQFSTQSPIRTTPSSASSVSSTFGSPFSPASTITPSQSLEATNQTPHDENPVPMPKKSPEEDQKSIHTSNRHASVFSPVLVKPEKKAGVTISAIRSLGLDWDRVTVKKRVIRCQAYVRAWIARRKYHKMKEAAKFRRNIMAEIVSTEKAFIQHLETMMKAYYAPLSGSHSCLTREEVDGIFSRHLPIIINLHRDILAQLHGRFDHWRFVSTVGDIFSRVAPFLKCHSEYVNHYEKSIRYLSTAQNRNPVKNFMKKVRDQGLMDLPSYLIMPVQRVPRYELLLKEMLKYTKNDHPDFSLLEKALTQVREVASLINAKNREAESLNKMLEIQQNHPNIVILAAHRRYVKYGEFELGVKGTFSKKVHRVTLHLCNDAMIMSFPKGLSSKTTDDVALLPLETIIVRVQQPAEGPARILELQSPALAIFSEQTKTVVLDTKENVHEWIEIINSTASTWIEHSYRQRGTHPIFTAAGPARDLGHVKYCQSLHRCERLVDAHGNTPCHIAAMYGNVDVLEFLFEQGVPANLLNGNGQTPLHLAVRRNSSACVVACVEQGAYINLPDRFGKPPLNYALETKNDKIILYLSEHGSRLANKALIPEELKCYIEKAIRTSSEIYARSSLVSPGGIRKPTDANRILEAHKRHVESLHAARVRSTDPPLCFLCSVNPRLMKFTCTQCQAICCQKCSFKRLPGSDQPKSMGQICDSCFTILAKHSIN
eukprot:TRINITY_DN5696_c0_g1_i1.p1 TRINITY_DN5696_c0_g1~~TRINITY_DN5696_c0_g1_i1.p1  ORF type:complete len:1219 (+),score=237.12 TRINITY_DN5696_c0_g1_i1:76-3732(+)